MSALIRTSSLSSAWLDAMERLLDYNGTDINLVVVFEPAAGEIEGVRNALDRFIAERRSQKIWPVRTVANTIFPEALYLRKLGDKARQHLYNMHLEGRSVGRRHIGNRYGSYFDRLVAWPGPNGEVNQLEMVVQRLRRQIVTGKPLTSAYELGLSVPAAHGRTTELRNGASVAEEHSSEELRVYLPGKDNRLYSFPCLSHISLTLVAGALHLTAIYRNQHFARRAYGNYLGLSRLLNFICNEVGCRTGEVVCVATHANAEINSGRGFGKGNLQALIAECREAERGSVSSVVGRV